MAEKGLRVFPFGCLAELSLKPVTHHGAAPVCLRTLRWLKSYFYSRHPRSTSMLLSRKLPNRSSAGRSLTFRGGGWGCGGWVFLLWVKLKPIKVGWCLHLVASLIIAIAPVSRNLWNFPPLDRNYELWPCAQLKQKANNRLGRLKSLKGATRSLFPTHRRNIKCEVCIRPPWDPIPLFLLELSL